jgi:glyceraldehyde 3-phosphate dehydrogenase
MINIAINGFGRIGKLVLKESLKRTDMRVVAINDLVEIEYLAYMLRYDSTHGTFDGDIQIENSDLIVNGNRIRVTNEKDPLNIHWDAVNADIVVEATGIFLTSEQAQLHIQAGAKRVLMT